MDGTKLYQEVTTMTITNQVIGMELINKRLSMIPLNLVNNINSNHIMILTFMI